MFGVGLLLALAAIDVSPAEVHLNGQVEVAYGPEPVGFVPAKDIINDGMSGRTMWVRFSLSNPTDRALERWLEIDNSTIDELVLDDGFEARTTGRNFPATSRELAKPGFAFRVQLSPHAERTFTLKVQTQNEQLVPLAVWEREALVAKDAFVGRWSALLYGIMLCAALVSLFHFAFVRERARLLYTGGVVLMGVWLFVLDGSAALVVPHTVVPRSWYLGPSLLAMTCNLFFMRELLQLKRTHPRVDRVVLAYYAAAVTLQLGCWLVSWRAQNIASSLVAPVDFLVFISLGVVRLREGFRPAFWFVLGWSVLTGFLLFATAIANGLPLPSMRLMIHAGFASEAVLLSLALADDARRRDRHVARLQEASARFVPTEFLSLLGKTELPEVRKGDQIERELSVFFLDIRSFTTMVEGMRPAETIALVNELFGRLGPAIAKEGGFIDKYIGDAVMALFEKPDAAVRAALGCLAALRGFNEGRAHPVSIGIGIHTGRVVLGTVGSTERLSCTVIGDTVNLASRIEGVTKALGAEVLMTGATAEALKEAMPTRHVDRVAVKGRAQAVDVFDPLAPSPDFVAARERYATGDFAGAAALFEKHIERAQGDKTALVLLERCRKYAGAPPSPWDGVIRVS